MGSFISKKFAGPMLVLTYALFSFSFFILFSSGMIDSQDGFQYVAVARRIYYDHSFELPEPDYPEHNVHLSVAKTADGKRYSPTGLGYSLALLPAVAFEDLFLRLAKLSPIEAFPLESDWPVLLAASMINAVFGAFAVTTLFLYLNTYDISVKKSAFWAFLLFISSNVFPYTKHVFAHMMFVSFLFFTFYTLRKYELSLQKRWLLLSGMSFGMTIISYNPTFILVLPSLGLYFLFGIYKNFSKYKISTIIQHVIFSIIGILPFLTLYSWFNALRFGNAASSGYGSGGIPLPPIPPVYVLFDGSWNLLFSSGKSIFLFTPVLLLLIFFWHKLPVKKIWSELIVFGLYAFISFYFTATLLGDVDFLLWHGESSWGPRYMVAILPGLLVCIGVLIQELKYKIEFLIASMLVLIGIWVQMCGMLLPYQIRFLGLDTNAKINGRNFTVYEYGNMIPRYSPVLTMSKTLVKRVATTSKLFSRGEYNLHLLDGFARPYRLGDITWRELLPKTLMSFDDTQSDIQQIAFDLRNHQIIPESTYSAMLIVKLNGQQISTSENVITINEEKTIIAEIDSALLQPSNNLLQLEPRFVGTTSALLKKQQVLFLQNFRINGQSQNLNLMDFPYVSPVSQQTWKIQYGYWGNIEKDPWELWHMHTGVYEDTFDLWWLRPLHYWDLPKKFFAILFLTNLSILLCSGYALKTQLISHKRIIPHISNN